MSVVGQGLLEQRHVHGITGRKWWGGDAGRNLCEHLGWKPKGFRPAMMVTTIKRFRLYDLHIAITFRRHGFP